MEEGEATDLDPFQLAFRKEEVSNLASRGQTGTLLTGCMTQERDKAQICLLDKESHSRGQNASFIPQSKEDILSVSKHHVYSIGDFK